METLSKELRSNLSMRKVLHLIFIPTSLLTLVYFLVGYSLGDKIPTLLLFFLLATLILFPIQLSVILAASKKEYGSYSLRSAFSVHEEQSWWKIIAYASLLWAFAGVMSATVAPLENMLFAPITERLSYIVPSYFNWSDVGYLHHYSRNMLLLTCVVYFVLNVFVGPIVEELFFRGYLTSKVSRFGKYAPLIITVLFSLYHLWLPFSNLFRIIVFYPAYHIAWKKKNIYIAIAFHCLCNLASAISFIVAVSTIL